MKHIYIIIITLIGLSSCNNYETPTVNNSKYIFGIDISHYQGKINWRKVKASHHPIKFVLIRSTMGDDGIDRRFNYNWKNSKKQGFIRGAYHYYRPNENSTKQFENFSENVDLEKGDLPPVLDIERLGKHGASNIRAGVLNWLRLAEKKYGIKPVVYIGRTFYNKYFKGYLKDYELWISSFAGKHKLKGMDWEFHQFTDKVRVKGIKGTVDGNDFNGEIEDLKRMCIK